MSPGLCERCVHARKIVSAKGLLSVWRHAIGVLRSLWTGEREIEGLPLSERDRTALATELAIRDVAGADA